MTSTGVYEIVNLVNGKCYIGSAVHFAKRWSAHRKALGRGQHHSIALQNAWTKYGANAFTFRKILLCASEHRLLYEQRCLDGLRPSYNIARDAAAPMTGRTHSQDARKKISAARLGKKMGPLLPETRAKISATLTGTKLSAEHRAKISAANKGKSISLEQRAKLSTAQRWRIHTAEQNAAHAERMRGRRHSPEHRAKISVALIGNKSNSGKTLPSATRIKMSLAHKGKPWSAKRRAAQRIIS